MVTGGCGDACALVAPFTHLGCAAYRRTGGRSAATRRFVLGVPIVLGVIFSSLIVLALAGALFPVEIPADYLATHGGAGR